MHQRAFINLLKEPSPQPKQHHLRAANDSSRQQVTPAPTAAYLCVLCVPWFHFPFLLSAQPYHSVGANRPRAYPIRHNETWFMIGRSNTAPAATNCFPASSMGWNVSSCLACSSVSQTLVLISDSVA